MIQPDRSAVGTEVWLYHYATENELPVLISRDRSVSKCFPLLPYTFINRLILISIFSIHRLLFQSCRSVGRLFMQHPWLGWSSLDVINSDKSKRVLWDRYMSCTNFTFVLMPAFDNHAIYKPNMGYLYGPMAPNWQVQIFPPRQLHGIGQGKLSVVTPGRWPRCTCVTSASGQMRGFWFSVLVKAY